MEKTALIIVDMINGFAKKGALASPRAAGVIPGIVDLQKKAKEKGIEIIAFADTHDEDCLEFKAYPKHCMAGDWESEVVDEIKAVGGYKLIPKNSTNCFHEKAFRDWLEEHPEIENYVIVGVCTDICISQLALTLKTFLNSRNIDKRVIVPSKYTQTFDLGEHDGDLYQKMALAFMAQSGVEVVEDIEL